MIKSVACYRKRVPPSQVEKVESLRALTNPFPITPKFWKKGLLISRKDGRACSFSLNDANNAKAELEGCLKTTSALAARHRFRKLRKKHLRDEAFA